MYEVKCFAVTELLISVNFFAEEAPRRLQVPHLGCLQTSVEMCGGAEILFYVTVFKGRTEGDLWRERFQPWLKISFQWAL